jgi:ornithine cyclodeaminase
MVVLGAEEVERFLPMAACIEAMAGALAELARGRTRQPLRSLFAPVGAPGAMVWMPAWRAGGPFAAKLLVIVPGNAARGLDAHQGAVALFDGATGELHAVVDAAAVTAIRTAAVSAVATRALARADARELAIVGTGVQAARHLEAIPLVRPIRRVRVAGRSPERARAFAARTGAIACDSVEEAVRGADIVVAATTATAPILETGWLAPGSHVNVVGGPPTQELAAETVAACALVADRRDALENEAREWRDGVARGLFGPAHVRAELGEIVAGLASGRRDDREITLFRSLGLAAEDLAAAELAVARAASARGAGRA